VYLPKHRVDGLFAGKSGYEFSKVVVKEISTPTRQEKDGIGALDRYR
jgi:hypothetical protein